MARDWKNEVGYKVRNRSRVVGGALCFCLRARSRMVAQIIQGHWNHSHLSADGDGRRTLWFREERRFLQPVYRNVQAWSLGFDSVNGQSPMRTARSASIQE